MFIVGSINNGGPDDWHLTTDSTGAAQAGLLWIGPVTLAGLVQRAARSIGTLGAITGYSRSLTLIMLGIQFDYLIAPAVLFESLGVTKIGEIHLFISPKPIAIEISCGAFTPSEQ